MHILLAPAKIGVGMFAAKSYTSRHYIAIVAMACLCVLLGGPSDRVENVGVRVTP